MRILITLVFTIIAFDALLLIGLSMTSKTLVLNNCREDCDVRKAMRVPCIRAMDVREPGG